MIEVGNEIKELPVTFGEMTGKGTALSTGKRMRGTVVYVHPEGRFYTLDFGHGCRESFIITDLEERAKIFGRSRQTGYIRPV